MKGFLLRMFSDKSDINPKAVVGVVSFITMVIYGLTDVVTGAIGKEFIFGCLGIAGAEAIFGNKNLKKEEKPE